MMKLGTFLRLYVFCLMLFYPNNGFSQEVEMLTFDDVCFKGGACITPTAASKVKRISSLRTGNIVLDDSECAGMPDSLHVALNVAADVWSGYLQEGVTLNIQVIYEDMVGSDIKTVVRYKSPDRKITYPSCLYRKLFAQQNDNSEFDAIIHINSQTEWGVGVGEGMMHSSLKNLSLGMLRAIAWTLGFGSSVKFDARGNLAFSVKKCLSAFDNIIFSDEGKSMKDLSYERQSEFKSFVEQDYGFLYASEKEEYYRLYAPKPYEDNKSLK